MRGHTIRIGTPVSRLTASAARYRHVQDSASLELAAWGGLVHEAWTILQADIVLARSCGVPETFIQSCYPADRVITPCDGC